MFLKRYRDIQKTNLVKGTEGKFVQPEVFGVPVPNMWAPLASAEETWAEYKKKFNLLPTRTPDMDSHMWPALDLLRFIFLSQTYMEHVEDPLHIELIVRGDGLPVGSSHAVFLVAMLGNFGILGKTLGFNFPLNLAEVSEKNRAKVRLALLENLITLNEWSKVGYVEIFPGLVVHIKVEWGGDESWLRLMLGLLSAKEQLACIKCLWRRQDVYDPATRVDRIIDALGRHFLRGTMDSAAPPLITHADMHQIHHCGMHAIIPFGKDILQRSFEHLQYQEQLGEPVWEAASQWLRRHNISVDITYP